MESGGIDITREENMEALLVNTQDVIVRVSTLNEVVKVMGAATKNNKPRHNFLMSQ